MSDDFVFNFGKRIKFDLMNFLLFVICIFSILLAILEGQIAVIGLGVIIFFKMPFFLHVIHNEEKEGENATD